MGQRTGEGLRSRISKARLGIEHDVGSEAEVVITWLQVPACVSERRPMRKKVKDRCPLRGREKRPGTTTFTADPGFGVVVIRQVPAMVCSQCGKDWIGDPTAARIEDAIENARPNTARSKCWPSIPPERE